MKTIDWNIVEMDARINDSISTYVVKRRIRCDLNVKMKGRVKSS